MAAFSINTIFGAVDKFSAPVQRMGASMVAFESGITSRFAKVQTGFGSFQKKMSGIQDGIFNLKGMLVGLGVYEFGKKIVEGAMAVAESGEKIALTSKRLGISAQTFKELKYAADLKGIDVDSLTSGLDKLNKNVGGLKLGIGPLNMLLKKTDPGLRNQLRTAKDTGQAFEIVAQAMDRIKDPTKRAVLATAAFGKGGMPMINMMNDGVEGLEKLRKEASKYGSAITNEAVEKQEKFIESYKRMNYAISGIKTMLMKEAIPVIQAYMETVSEWIASHRELIKTKVHDFIEKIKNTGKALLPILKFIVNHIDTIIKAILLLVATNLLLKGVSIAFKGIQLAIMAANFATGIFMVTQKALPVALGANSAALTGYNIATKAVTIGQWLFNAALWACPITWIVMGIIAAVAAIVLMIVYWDKVKKKVDEFSNSAIWQILSFVFPIMKVVELISFMQDRWKAIKKAFSDGGILNGLKVVGRALLSFILKPLEVILAAVGKIPGMGFAAKGSMAIANFRQDLDKGLVEEKKPVNTLAATTQTQNNRYEEIKKNQIDIQLTNKTDKDAILKRNLAMIPITTSSVK